MNGKEIILQRLRGNNLIKSLRFIEKEKKEIFDLNSEKYSFYKFGEIFKLTKIKKSDFIADNIEKEIKPEWITERNFKDIISELDEKAKIKLIDEAIDKIDKKTERVYNNFNYFNDKQKEFFREKGQNILFNVEYLVTGKLDDGTEIRFPFALREYKEIKINKVKKIKFKEISKSNH